MKYFATLLRAPDVEALGTFATTRLDGRNSMHVMRTDAKRLLDRERELDKGLKGYRIYSCEAIGRNETTLFSVILY